MTLHGRRSPICGSASKSSPCEDGVASAEDHIAAEVHIQLLLEGLPDVNFREDTEAFGPEGFGNLPNGASFSSVFSHP